MSSRAGQLTGFLRRMQWQLDETAHVLPEGRATVEQCRAMAEGLEELAGALRDYAGQPNIFDMKELT